MFSTMVSLHAVLPVLPLLSQLLYSRHCLVVLFSCGMAAAVSLLVVMYYVLYHGVTSCSVTGVDVDFICVWST